MSESELKESFQMKFYLKKAIKHICIWGSVMLVSILMPVIAPKSSSVEKSIGIYFFLMILFTLVMAPFICSYLVKYFTILKNKDSYVLLTGDFADTSVWKFGTEYGLFCNIIVDDVKIRVETDTLFNKKNIGDFIAHRITFLYNPTTSKVVIIRSENTKSGNAE